MESDDDIMALLEAPTKSKSKSKKSNSKRSSLQKADATEQRNEIVKHKEVSFDTETKREAPPFDKIQNKEENFIVRPAKNHLRASALELNDLMGISDEKPSLGVGDASKSDPSRISNNISKTQLSFVNPKIRSNVSLPSTAGSNYAHGEIDDTRTVAIDSNILDSTEKKIVACVENALHQRHLQDNKCASEVRLVNKRLDQSINEIVKKCNETISILEVKNESHMDSLVPLLDSNTKSFSSLSTICEDIKSLIHASEQRRIQNSEQIATLWQSPMNSLSELLNEARASIQQQRDLGETLKKQMLDVELRASRLEAREETLKVEERRLDSLRKEHLENVKDLERQRKSDEDRIRELQELVRKEASIIEKQRETVLLDVEAAKIKSIEIEKKMKRCDFEEAKLDTLRKEVNQLGEIILDRATKAEDMMTRAESKNVETTSERGRISAMISQLEMKQSTKFSLSNKQSDYLNIVRERVNLLQDFDNKELCPKAHTFPELNFRSTQHSNQRETWTCDKSRNNYRYSNNKFSTSLFMASIREQVRQLSDPLLLV